MANSKTWMLHSEAQLREYQSMMDGACCTITVKSPVEVLRFSCKWWWRPTNKDGLLYSLHIVPQALEETVETEMKTTEPHAILVQSPGSSDYLLETTKGIAISEFVSDLFKRNLVDTLDKPAAIFLVPSAGGFVAHSEFLSQRLAACALVSSATSFLQPLSKVLPFFGEVEGAKGIAEALEACVGALEVDVSVLQERSDELVWELGRRLSFPWLLPECPPHRRIVVVTNAENLRQSRPRWANAAALGVTCVIVSPSIWWPDNSPDSDLREACLAADFTQDGLLWQRIVETVKAYPFPVDGIVTPADRYLVDVAKAAKELGLYTLDPTVLSLCTNKCLTAGLLDPSSREHFVVKSMDELNLVLTSGRSVPFPAVCKPAVGRSSEGVFISNDPAQLRDAIAKTFVSSKGVQEVLVEPYIDGPEVDANLVILEGELLYAEVVDDFPKPGDLAKGTAGDIFTETQTLIPSKLPADEQEEIINAMLEVVLKQGFLTGVFHCEARVRNSRMAYNFTAGASIPDLQPSEQHKLHEKTTIFLHEVNPRPPGVVCVLRSFFSQGVDFWCLSILAAIQDWSRLRSLSIPFGHRYEGGHFLNMTVNVYISSQLVRTMLPDVPEERFHRHFIPASHDPIPDLLRRHPEVVGHVIHHNPIIILSDRYGQSGESVVWDATVVIRSMESREEAVALAEKFEILYKAYLGELYTGQVVL